jgi:hypothetical protein
MLRSPVLLVDVVQVVEEGIWFRGAFKPLRELLHHVDLDADEGRGAWPSPGSADRPG